MFCRRHQEFEFLRGLRIEWGINTPGGSLQSIPTAGWRHRGRRHDQAFFHHGYPPDACRGLRVVMLTGDNRRVADAIAGEAGVDEVIADVLPVRRWR
jgi:hypothetical protein